MGITGERQRSCGGARGRRRKRDEERRRETKRDEARGSERRNKINESLRDPDQIAPLTLQSLRSLCSTAIARALASADNNGLAGWIARWRDGKSDAGSREAKAKNRLWHGHLGQVACRISQGSRWE
ncbi:hypothetical protein VTH06DRAFT_7808 [Thermothelomyces fergusii]